MSLNSVVDIRSCNSYLIGLHTKFGPINSRGTMKSGRPKIMPRNIMVITHPTELLFYSITGTLMDNSSLKGRLSDINNGVTHKAGFEK